MAVANSRPMQLAINESEPGYDLSLSYMMLSQLITVYVEIAKVEPDEQRRVSWYSVSDQAMNDLVLLYEMWGKGRDVEQQLDAGVRKRLRRRLRTAERRITIILNHLNVWTPLSRWVRIVIMLESKWAKIVADLAMVHPTFGSNTNDLRSSQRLRWEVVKSLRDTFVEKQDKRDRNYAVPKPML